MKYIYIFLIAVLANISFQHTVFAYDYYTDNGMNYSNEQFRRDMKSYLDEQMQRQENQELLDRIRSNNSGHSQEDVQRLQEQFDKQKQDNEKTIEEMRKMIDEVNSNSAQLLNEKETYENTKAFCSSLKEKYQQSGASVELVASCKKYGVDIPVLKNTSNEMSFEEIMAMGNNKKTPEKNTKDLQLQKSPTLDEILADMDTPQESVKPEQKQKFFTRVVQKVKSLIFWWR